MLFPITGYLSRRSASKRPPPKPPPRPSPPPPDYADRERICRGCDWYTGEKCQHLGCPVCPGRQRGEPWRIVPRCPAGHWERKTPPVGGV